ncbi:DNA glycosylase [Obba rivulosa]|uniref:Endonuclease III homolog n=1 Tax=Obba rivulosa TaxID=1052685 RepID=A0A8E2AMV5_9APHY|nr:DNA glycosylase [Obba rivulosa]
MSALKRRASPVLTARSSPYHSSVTLFDTSDTNPATAVRRSKRLKVTVEPDASADDEHNAVTPPSPAKKGATRKRVIVKAEATLDTKLEESSIELPNPSRGKGKGAPPRKSKSVPQSLEVPHPAPPRWRETYDTIKEMRSRIVAPVDTMGCAQAQLKEQDPKNQRFATLVSLMLSSQTKDEVTDAAVAKLRDAVGGSLSVEAVIAAEGSAIADAICKVGFWRRKTQYIKQAAQRLRDDFESDVPKSVDELCSLPGVGPKMAFLALQVAWNLNVGIGVDVHVHRITNRLGWHKPPTKTPEETRLNLQSWLPSELHPEINPLLVGFGQMICLPVNPRCDMCELSTGLCPSARKVVRRTVKTVKTEDDLSGPKVEVVLETQKAIIPASAGDP